MNRRELREHIFRILFQTGFHEKDQMPQQCQMYIEDLQEPSEAEMAYIEAKVTGVLERLEELDKMIDEVATGWKTDRMGKADLTIIRLACYEMKFDADIPEQVAINEGVELAKRYGSDESPSFVNGVLAKLI